MATQLDDSRVERKSVQNVTDNIVQKPITLNFAMMVMVALTLDIIGLFLSWFPGVGISLVIISNVIFIPWFYFSGIKYTGKKIGSTLATFVVESIPILGNIPCITANVFFCYYSK